MATVNKEAALGAQYYRGQGIGQGRAMGRLHFFRRGQPYAPLTDQASATPQEELERLRAALRQAAGELEELFARAAEQLGEEQAEIFEIHGMILTDGDFLEPIEHEIAAGKSAEGAVQAASDALAASLSALQDAYLSARAADIRDVAGRLLSILTKAPSVDVQHGGEPYILAAHDLSPSETMLLDRSLILGFVTFGGSITSHTAILANAMGIPALIGTGELEPSCEGETVLLDAVSGTLTVSPTDEETERFGRLLALEEEQRAEREAELSELLQQEPVTQSGHRMLVYANIGDPAECEAVLRGGGEGIGLYRSELLYLSLGRYPTEEELFAAYRTAALAMQGRRVIIRTLDIGADKQAGYFELPREENPALGFRAVRLCLARRELFRTQLRAVLRASAFGRVALMIPMVVSAEEIRACRELLADCRRELTEEGIALSEELELGIMVETPAAAVMSRELAREVDFFSVGTNDLLQYTLAADRQNPALSELCRANTEPVLRLIRTAADAIHERGGWIGICGELAADVTLTQRFADMHIDELSVSPPHLPAIRRAIRACH